MSKYKKNESNPEKLMEVQAELDRLHSEEKLNVKYEVLGGRMVRGRGLVVKLKCLFCDKIKERKMADIRYAPNKGGCICQRKHTEEIVRSRLQKILGKDFKVKRVYRKQTTSRKAKYVKKPFHADIYDVMRQVTYQGVNMNNIFSKNSRPMPTTMNADEEVASLVESTWPSLKVQFVSRPQWVLKESRKKINFHSMIFSFVRCTRCGEEYFKKFIRSQKATRTFCCGIGGTTGKREDFTRKCKSNEGKGLLYFCYLRHALGYEYIKQGITSKMGLDERMSYYKKEGFIEVIVYRTYVGNAGEIYDMEQHLLNAKPFEKTMVKFDGCSECYEWDVIPRLCTKKDRAYVWKWRGKVRAGKTKRSWSNFVEFLGDEKRHALDLKRLRD